MHTHTFIHTSINRLFNMCCRRKEGQALPWRRRWSERRRSNQVCTHIFRLCCLVAVCTQSSLSVSSDGLCLIKESTDARPPFHQLHCLYDRFSKVLIVLVECTIYLPSLNTCVLFPASYLCTHSFNLLYNGLHLKCVYIYLFPPCFSTRINSNLLAPSDRYLKKESVDLALQLLDQSTIRPGYTITVTRVRVSLLLVISVAMSVSCQQCLCTHYVA